MITKKIRVAIAGLGNCAANLVEGLSYYKDSTSFDGVLFPILGGYSINDIEIVCAFDISANKVGLHIHDAIYKEPNNFNRIEKHNICKSSAVVYRGKTLDGNPDHLAIFVRESEEEECDVVEILQQNKVDILVNLLPTGSVEATKYYGMCALEANCAFINCIPTVFAQNTEIAKLFQNKGLPLIGDDIKSQLGTTILHRQILNMLTDRGAEIIKSTQINVGGNTDFANFVHRADTKLISKYKSLKQYIGDETPNHVGHHYDKTQGAFKKAFIEVISSVFGNSKVKISIQLESDDKANASGSIIDCIRVAKYELALGNGGVIKAPSAYYMKSNPFQIEDKVAFNLLNENYIS